MTRRHKGSASVLLLTSTIALVFATMPSVAGAQTSTTSHCATLLVPTGETSTSPQGSETIEAELVEIGCYDTFEEAVETGSMGSVDLPAGTEPQDLTQATLDASIDGDVTAMSSVAIGTEWVQESYASSSNTYFASSTCTDSTTWQVSYVGNTYNDDFESGKGFGGCDRNRKFEHSNFDGDVLVCRPNCSDYGSLGNRVSSLRWRN
jgi:hypothetical protein